MEAHVGAADEIRIDLAAKSEGAAGLTALVAAQTKQEVSIEEGVVRSRITFSYEISRSELKQLTLNYQPKKISKW